MKLINKTHTYGNPVIHDSAVMGGCIKMTGAEWKEARTFLQKTKKLHDGTNTYLSFYRNLLRKDIDSATTDSKGKTTRLNIRVPATKILAEQFGLTNYQRRNYVIEITH